MALITIDEALTGKDLYNFLVTNKKALIAQKKYTIKEGDAFRSSFFVNSKGEIQKSFAPINENATQLEVTSIINTTNWLDSHKDVHLPGLWKKSLNETKDLYLLQEHSMTFKGIISDDVQAFTKNMAWSQLGVNAPGMTEALVFVSNVSKARNEFMFNEYKQNRVKNHSVGMRYVTIDLAINDDSKYYKDEYEVWNKYIDQIANKDEAEETGYFWAVTQAKVVEGSAVPLGSNRITPTESVSSKQTISDTDREPSPDTSKDQPPPFDLLKAIQETTFIN